MQVTLKRKKKWIHDNLISYLIDTCLLNRVDTEVVLKAYNEIYNIQAERPFSA